MALSICPDCGRQISTVAAACPNCGRPMGPPPVIPPPQAQQPQKAVGPYICETCGCQGWAKTFTPGSLAIEFLLWCCFLVPGMIYSAWRLTSRRAACPHCHGAMIGVTTPRGQLLLRQFSSPATALAR